MEEQEQWGDYMDDEEDFGGMVEEEEPSMQEEEMAEKVVPRGLKERNYKYNLLDLKDLRSTLLGQLLNLKSSFEYAQLSDGVYLTYLRKHRYLLSKAKEDLEQDICDILEDPKYQLVDLKPNLHYMCNILCEEFPFNEIRHFGCGHTFHVDCMREYICEQINSKGPNSISTLCPYQGCEFILPQGLVEDICTKEQKTLFDKFILDHFVANAPYIINCIGVNCNNHFSTDDRLVTEDMKLPINNAICPCGMVTCMCCRKRAHEPLNCAMHGEWSRSIEKILDTLNASWKKNNSRPCPKCAVDIQKNQGCMHMTCSKCKHEYCWLCMGDWKSHGSNTGGFFKCNLYKEEETQKEKDDSRKLQFYCDRYFAHNKSLEVSEEKYKVMCQKFDDPKSTVFELQANVQEGCLEFYREAFRTILKCRSFVTFTYPLAYFFKNERELMLFLETQKMLEMALEKLNKFVDINPIESFIEQSVKGISFSQKYGEMRQSLINLNINLNVQFENADREFKDESFLAKIALERKAKADQMEKVVEALVGKKSASKSKNDWMRPDMFYSG